MEGMVRSTSNQVGQFDGDMLEGPLHQYGAKGFTAILQPCYTQYCNIFTIP